MSAAEKQLPKDRDWIDEEEADLILAIREEKQHGLRGGNIHDFARRHGRYFEVLPQVCGLDGVWRDIPREVLGDLSKPKPPASAS